MFQSVFQLICSSSSSVQCIKSTHITTASSSSCRRHRCRRCRRCRRRRSSISSSRTTCISARINPRPSARLTYGRVGVICQAIGRLQTIPVSISCLRLQGCRLPQKYHGYNPETETGTCRAKLPSPRCRIYCKWTLSSGSALKIPSVWTASKSKCNCRRKGETWYRRLFVSSFIQPPPARALS